ncbi:hypothetical protein G9A89_009996 [Geosiphon pyriformis]|nr:hypothetical protein G9A89_009996 [Geosiphon pyriformis]
MVLDLFSREKKKRDSILENGSGGGNSSETGDTTESKSIDMKKECLVEETSFDYDESSALAGGNHDQTSTGSKVKTKKALDKSLGKIDFSPSNNDDDVLLDVLLVLLPPTKNLVNVSVWKFFVLDIGLDIVVGKSSCEKLLVVRNLAMFISKLSLMKATKLAADVKILVNTNLKKSFGCSDWAVILKKIPVGTSTEAVCTALSSFGVVVSIKMQLMGLWQKAVIEFIAACWSILIGKDAVYYIGSVGEKTCAIDCYSVMYAQTRCVVVCFDLADSLNAVMGTTPVLRDVNMCWSLLGFSKCAKCGKLGHTFLGCAVGENISFGKHPCRPFSDLDKSRLATNYAKRLALIIRFVIFSGVSWAKITGGNVFPPFFVRKVLVNPGFSSEMKPTIHDTSDIEKRFAVLESSLASLVGQIDELAKRLNSFMLADQVGDVVMGKGLGKATNGETVTTLNSSASTEVKRLKSMLEGLSVSVLSLIARFDVWKIATCNVKGMNNSAKQDDVICWHKEINNLISVIMNKFDGVQVFTSGLNSGYLGSGVVIIMNISLVRHICKVSEVPGYLLSLKLLFKNNFSVSILGLYAGILLVVRFSQAGEINSLIAKAVNESSFCVSFKKCFDLGLVDSLGGSLFVKTLTWTNSHSVTKAFNYVLIFSSLVNAVTDSSVADVKKYFDTDHKALSASVGLGGLLNVYLSSICKQANKDYWKFDVKSVDVIKWGEFKDATAANAAMFLDKFEAAKKFSDLDAMWDTVHKVIVFSANSAFKKKWFKDYDGVFTKKSFKLHNLKVLVLKIVKASFSIDSDKASVVCDLVSSGASFNCVCSALCGMKRYYCASKLAEFLQAKESGIRSAIERRIESFVVNKGHTICSVLECPFRKVVLNHLVSNSGLILDPVEVKNKIDSIMEGWTRKRAILKSVPDLWQCQYLLLNYVDNNAFSVLPDKIRDII